MDSYRKKYNNIIMTLDAGGTTFVFGAMQDCSPVLNELRLPSNGDDLRKSLDTLFEGFYCIKKLLPANPEAISIAFPGPCDYEAGIVFNQKNLPSYREKIPLKYMLEKEFGIPVFMHNDADLFAYGETHRGLLQKVNHSLASNGSTRTYQNLLGITLGTGFGAGIVNQTHLFRGDNSSAAEVWALRNKKAPYCHVEGAISAGGLVRIYKRFADISEDTTILAKDISKIALGEIKGNQDAALAAFNEFGEILGSALIDITVITDSLIVIGGGLANAYDLFIKPLIKEMNSKIKTAEGTSIGRLTFPVFNLENPEEYEEFCSKNQQIIHVPFSNEVIPYYGIRRIGIGKSSHETSHSIAIGAYLLAVRELGNII